MKEAPFPQADNFHKIISIVTIDDEAKLKSKNTMAIYLGDITERQVDYYMSACRFLGLINEKKEFTELGQSVRKLTGAMLYAELARIIISIPIFGRIFFLQHSLKMSLDKNDVVELMKKEVCFNTEQLYYRRGTTLMCWLRWIEDNVM